MLSFRSLGSSPGAVWLQCSQCSLLPPAGTDGVCFIFVISGPGPLAGRRETSHIALRRFSRSVTEPQKHRERRRIKGSSPYLNRQRCVTWNRPKANLAHPVYVVTT